MKHLQEQLAHKELGHGDSGLPYVKGSVVVVVVVGVGVDGVAEVRSSLVVSMTWVRVGLA